MTSKHNAEVLSHVSECKKAVVCLTEEKGVLGKLHVGMSCIAVGHEFDVRNQQYILNTVS